MNDAIKRKGNPKSNEQGRQEKRIQYKSPPLTAGDMFQDPQWMPETTDHTEPYTHYVFSYTYIPMIKFSV